MQYSGRAAVQRFFGRLAMIFALPVLLGACATTNLRTADPAEIASAAYVHDAPPSITLLTVVNSASGAGDHSALIINASQRVLYDPAGSYNHPQVPQNLDVHFGFRPQVEATYVDYHARESHHVITQELRVPADVAEAALRAVLAESKARSGQCSIKTAGILRSVGFDVGSSIWPRTTMNNFAAQPGLITTILVAPGMNPSNLGLAPEAVATARRVTAPSGTYTALDRGGATSRADTTATGLAW